MLDLLPFAPTAIMDITHTPVRLTVTTVLAGSPAASLSELAHGSAAASADVPVSADVALGAASKAADSLVVGSQDAAQLVAGSVAALDM